MKWIKCKLFTNNYRGESRLNMQRTFVHLGKRPVQNLHLHRKHADCFVTSPSFTQ